MENEEKFKQITNSVKDAIILVDEESKVAYWNPASEKTFGYSSLEAIGKDIHELVVPTSMCQEGMERIEQSMNIFAETGMGYFTVGNVELIGRHKNGTEFPVELSISPADSPRRTPARRRFRRSLRGSTLGTSVGLTSPTASCTSGMKA